MRIIVFGAGIAGLTAAHYLVQRGHQVLVVEKSSVPGGMARSERTTGNLPIEYSFRGLGPWYNNAFSVMKEIQDGDKKVYENLEPIEFNLLDKHGSGPLDWIKLGWLLAKSFAASPGRQQEYAQISAKEALGILSPSAAHDVGWTLGPGTGTDIGHASYHHVSKFLQRNTFPGVTHTWPAGYRQGSNASWMVVTKPINEAWFDPWVKQLKSQGVEFLWNSEVISLDQQAIVKTGQGEITLDADHFVVAINPFVAQKLLNLDPRFLSEPHRQISYRVIFKDRLHLPPMQAYILMDSPFDLTFYSQQDSFLEPWYKTLWSGTATVDSVPGLLGKPMSAVTKEEMIAEIRLQMLTSRDLQALVYKHNGRSLDSFDFEIQLWPTWQFPPDAPTVQDPMHKWVNDFHNRPFQPQQTFGKIILAGAHVKTNADLYSMEAAVQSGKRAADLITGQDTVIKQYVPLFLRGLQKLDEPLYALGLPNVMTVLITILILACVFLMIHSL